MMQQMLLGLGPSGVDIDDVFSVDLYNGTGGVSNKTITNDIDFSGEGGLVWIKSRDALDSHFWADTERGVYKYLYSDSFQSEFNKTDSLISWNSNGFTLGTRLVANPWSGGAAVAWSFRQAPKFFDVVTYTGTGSNRTFSHNLGTEPGLIIIKRRDANEHWAVYSAAADAGPTKVGFLNFSNGWQSNSYAFNNTSPTSSVVTVGASAWTNENNGTYVAYLFAKDTDLIKCDQYTGNGQMGGPTINVGFQPQFILIKRTNGAADWAVLDTTRGITTGDDRVVVPNSSGYDYGTQVLDLTSSGFEIKTNNNQFNFNGGRYTYVAIAAP